MRRILSGVNEMVRKYSFSHTTPPIITPIVVEPTPVITHSESKREPEPEPEPKEVIDNNIDPALILKMRHLIDSKNSTKLNLLLEEHNELDINFIYTQMYNRSLLMAACETGSLECVQLLLNKNADINQYSRKSGCFPLLCACSANNIEIFNYLIIQGAVLNDELIFECLHTLTEEPGDSKELVMLLLTYIKDVNIQSHAHYSYYILLVCKLGYVDSVRYLLDRGATDNPYQNYDDDNALSVAGSKGNIPLINMLFEWKGSDGFDIKALNHAFRMACRFGHIEVVRIMIDKGCDINEKSRESVTAIQWVISYNHMHILELLLTHNIYLETTNSYPCKSALYFACDNHQNYDRIIRLLIKYGANINALNDRGNTCLFDHLYDIKKSRLLLELGANPNIRVPITHTNKYTYKTTTTKYHTTALMYAVNNACTDRYIINDKIDFIKLLLIHHADPNIPDTDYGTTPLICAATAGCIDIVRVLLEYGADVTHVDNSDRNVLVQLQAVIEGEEEGSEVYKKYKEISDICIQYIDINQRPLEAILK